MPDATNGQCFCRDSLMLQDAAKLPIILSPETHFAQEEGKAQLTFSQTTREKLRLLTVMLMLVATCQLVWLIIPSHHHILTLSACQKKWHQVVARHPDQEIWFQRWLHRSWRAREWNPLSAFVTSLPAAAPPQNSIQPEFLPLLKIEKAGDAVLPLDTFICSTSKVYIQIVYTS